jgi:hypothetical protein
MMREHSCDHVKKAIQSIGNLRSKGVVRFKSGASRGYILFSPLLSTTTYLIDIKGRVVHTWESDFAPGASVYLLDNGNLLRCARQPNAPTFHGGGQGGRIQEFSWDGKLTWDWVIASEKRLQHHDIEPLPNGNVLLIVWEHKTRKQAIRAGRKPYRVGPAGLWPDCILEVRPLRPTGGRIVWEWHLWDHLIQDSNPGFENYGNAAEHPELIDINGDRGPERITDKQLQRLKTLGYISDDTTKKDFNADFTHTNAIAYNPQLDQIALCVLWFNEIWIIDHSTTTAEAAGHIGGRAGRGGDLLYRWGNPRVYRRGTVKHQQFFLQHDVRWIPRNYPGGGNIMVFNNGPGRPEGRYSSVIEIEPPVDANGNYFIRAEKPFGPDKPTWEYTAPNKVSFFADFISGAHRLVNGNTFICSGPRGRFFEVTPNGDIVWQYENPYSGHVENPTGDPPYSVFRATHIPLDHPALVNRNLKPLDPQPPYLCP